MRGHLVMRTLAAGRIAVAGVLAAAGLASSPTRAQPTAAASPAASAPAGVAAAPAPADTADTRDLDAIVWSLEALPANPPLRRALQAAAARHGLVFWDFNPAAMARAQKENGKDAVVVNESLVKMDPAVSSAWIAFALGQIVVRSPDGLKRPDYAPYAYPFRADFIPIMEMVKMWKESRTKNPALHDPVLDAFARFDDAGLLPAYVYLQFFDASRIADYHAWLAGNRAQVDALLRRFLLVPGDAAPSPQPPAATP